jgi:amidase
MPSSFCGIYGMKPTHGLVPYTGIMPIEVFIDHTGPMTASVRDNATLLQVIAGADGYDPRQYAPKVDDYLQRLEDGVRGMKIALVKEGFGLPKSERAVDDKVRAAAGRLGKLGAKVSEMSIPWHALADSLFIPIATEGLTQTMMLGDGYGVSRPDLYVTSLMDHHRGWRRRANELSETTKLFLLFGVYVREYYGSRYYGKSVNLARRLAAAYDAALADHDLLLMPTTPMKATPLPEPGSPREVVVERAFEMVTNTAPFDVSHHPAMAVPCGMSDGLPISMMLVGKHFDEATIYRAAYAFEKDANWKNL